MTKQLSFEHAQELYTKSMGIRGALEDFMEYLDNNYDELKDTQLLKLLDTWQKCEKLDDRMFEFETRIECICPQVQ